MVAKLPNLPVEILLDILHLLDVPTLKSLRPTCRRLNSISSSLLFRSVALRIKNHHQSGCPDHETEPHRSRKLDEYASFPHVLHLLPRKIIISSKRPDDTHQCMKSACKLDLRAFKRVFSASLLANLTSAKKAEIDLDYRFLSSNEIAIVNGALKGIKEGAEVNVRFRNISVNAELFVRGFEDLPVARLSGLDVSFRDSKAVLVEAAKDKLLVSLGKILNGGKKLTFLKLEAWNRLRNGAIDLDVILNNAGEITSPLETLELDGVAAPNLSADNLKKLPKMRKLLLRGTITAGMLAKFAEHKHALSALAIDNIREEFFEYVESSPITLKEVHVYRTESHRASDDKMAARFWSEAYPMFRNNVKHVKMYSCRMTPSRPKEGQYIAGYELHRQTTCLANTVLTASPTLKTLAVCVTAGKKMDHNIKDLIMNSPRLRRVEFCFHVAGRGAVGCIVKILNRMLKTIIPKRKSLVIECVFSDPQHKHDVGSKEGESLRCLHFKYGFNGWQEEWQVVPEE